MPDSPTSEPESDFVCDCGDVVRTACFGEPSYQVNELVLRSGKVEGKRYCVLHFPSKEKTEPFCAAIQSKLKDGDSDFSHAHFEERADFGSATFRGVANFDHASFNALAYFSSVVFEGRTYFSH